MLKQLSELRVLDRVLHESDDTIHQNKETFSYDAISKGEIETTRNSSSRISQMIHSPLLLLIYPCCQRLVL